MTVENPEVSVELLWYNKMKIVNIYKDLLDNTDNCTFPVKI